MSATWLLSWAVSCRFVPARLIALGALIPLSIATAVAEPFTACRIHASATARGSPTPPAVLRAETIAKLNAAIGGCERTTGAEMASSGREVAGRPIGGGSSGQTVRALGDRQEGKDNGLLLLWSTSDRRVRLEVGDGLEGTLPDGKAGAIIDTYMMAAFKSGEFDEGVLAGVDAILRAARNEPVALTSSRSVATSPDHVASWRGSVLRPAGLQGATLRGLGSIRFPEVAPTPPPPMSAVSDEDDPTQRSRRQRAARGRAAGGRTGRER